MLFLCVLGVGKERERATLPYASAEGYSGAVLPDAHPMSWGGKKGEIQLPFFVLIYF